MNYAARMVLKGQDVVNHGKWVQISKAMRKTVTPAQYELWIKPLQAIEKTKSDGAVEILLVARNAFVTDWFRMEYLVRIREIGKRYGVSEVRLKTLKGKAAERLRRLIHCQSEEVRKTARSTDARKKRFEAFEFIVADAGVKFSRRGAARFRKIFLKQPERSAGLMSFAIYFAECALSGEDYGIKVRAWD